MADLQEYIIFLIMQFLAEENFNDSLHKLEEESECYFNTTYFKELVISGSWTKAQKYLSEFTSADDNIYSRKIFFELGKQKYLDALDRRDYASTHAILFQEFKPLITFKEEFPEIEKLSKLDNFRDHENYKNPENAVQERKQLVDKIEKLLATNPQLRGIRNFPDVGKNTLKNILRHSLQREHSLGSSSQDENVFHQAVNMTSAFSHYSVQNQVRQTMQSTSIYEHELGNVDMSVGSSSRAENQTETGLGGPNFRG